MRLTLDDEDPKQAQVDSVQVGPFRFRLSEPLGRGRGWGSVGMRAGRRGWLRFSTPLGGARRRGAAPAVTHARPPGWRARKAGSTLVAWPGTSTSIRPTRSVARSPVADMVREGGVIAYPTDSCYALGCQIGNKDGIERIRAIRHSMTGTT